MPPLPGAGVRFAGRGAPSHIVGPTGLLDGATVVTLEAWIRPKNLDVRGTIFEKGGTGANPHYGMAVGGNSLASGYLFGTSVGGQPNLGSPTITADEWQHVALVIDAAGMRGYRNAVLVGSSAITITTRAGAWRVGIDADGAAAFAGAIAGMRVYSRALTADEVAVRYAGREIDRTGLVLDLPLDEGVGPKALDRSDVPVFDGTLTAGPTWLQPKADRGITSQPDPTTAAGRIDFPSDPTAALSSFTAHGWWRLRQLSPASGWFPEAFGTYNGSGWAIETSGATQFTLYIRDSVGVKSAVGTWTKPGDWHHFAVVVVPGLASVYLNGVLAASVALVGALVPGGPFRIGNVGSSGVGSMARGVGIHSRALTVAEIRSIVLGVPPQRIADCIVYLPLEDDTLNVAPTGIRPRNLVTRAGLDLNTKAGGWNTNDSGNVAVENTVLFGEILQQIRRLTTTGTADVTGLYIGTRPTVEPGKRYTFSVDVLALDVDRGATLQLAWHVANGSFASVGVATQIPSSSGTATKDGWIRLVESGIAPVGAVTAAPTLVIAAAQAGERFVARRWTGVEGDGGAFVPSSDNVAAPAAHGTPVSSPRFVRPRARDGARGPGRVDVARTAGLAASYASSFSLAAWVRPGGPSSPLIVVDEDAGAAQGFGIESNLALGSRYNAWALSGGNFIAGPVVDRAWHHVCVTYDRATGMFSFFVDGILYGSRVLTIGASVYTTTFLRTFQAQSNTTSTGTIDAQVADLQWISGALTADEVAALVAGVAPSKGRLVGEWLTPGSIVGAVALDTSGNGGHGVLAGGAVAA